MINPVLINGFEKKGERLDEKIGLFFILILLGVGIGLNGSLAQDAVEWHFTEGAKMRLGKGKINDIQFSPLVWDWETLKKAGNW